MRAIAIFLSIFACTSLWAEEIYKCVKPDGAVFFKDTACSVKDLQSVYQYTEQPITKHDVQRMQSKYKRYQADLMKESKRLIKRQQRAQKQQEQAQKRAMRLHAKCERVMQQIGQLNLRLKHGYTAKQRASIDRKLAEYEVKRQKYCGTK